MPPLCAALADPAFRALRDRQSMVLSRAQLGALTIGRQLIARRVRAELWQTVGPHVVVLHNATLTRQQQYWAGVLHAGPGAALSGLTALEAAGFTGFRADEVVTVVAHGSGRRHLVTDAVSVRVHESSTLAAGDVLARAAPPRVRQATAAVLAASSARSDRACATIIAMVVQQRLAPPGQLRSLVEQRSRLRRRALILETLRDVAGGSESLPELEYLAGLRRFGLPVPTRQRPVRRPDGRYRLDADFDEWLVTVEINGAHHLEVQQKERDDVRRTRLAIGGRLVVDLGSRTVRRDSTLAVLLTADALFSRGWAPPAGVRRRLLAAARRRRGFAWTSPMAA